MTDVRNDLANPGRRRWLAAAALAGAGLGLHALRAAPAPAVALVADEMLGRYGFPPPHPFGTDRQAVFLREVRAAGLDAAVEMLAGRPASIVELQRFHSAEFLAFVADAEHNGREFLDDGDTPVFAGVYATSAYVVGAALATLEQVMAGTLRRSFQAIGGLHHAGRNHASGFCVFNDLGVVIETLRSVYRVRRVAYVDIDAHHGDGIYYAFETDPDVIIADIHQDSRTLFPGSGRADETGRGAARGTKLNIELPPRAGDREFLRAWPAVEQHLTRFAPEFFILQCGADSLAGDPLAQLAYTSAAHAHAARRVRALAEQHASGRVMAFGGGGYNRANLAQAWTAVLRELTA